MVGDIDVDAMEKTIKASFSSLKNPVHEKKRINYTVPLNGKDQFIAVTDKEMTSMVAEVIIKHKAPEMETAIDYRNGVITGLFNQMLGERYTRLSSQANPPFIQGGAGISGFLDGLDSYDATVTAKPGEAGRRLQGALAGNGTYTAVWFYPIRTRPGKSQPTLTGWRKASKGKRQNQFIQLCRRIPALVSERRSFAGYHCGIRAYKK